MREGVESNFVASPNLLFPTTSYLPQSYRSSPVSSQLITSFFVHPHIRFAYRLLAVR